MIINDVNITELPDTGSNTYCPYTRVFPSI